MRSLRADVVVTAGGFELRAGFEAAAGEWVALVGPNGAGKSTLVRCLAGLTPIERGRISLGDRALDHPDQGIFVPARGRRIGVMFQDLRLFPSLTALDNVAFGVRSAGTSRSAARVIAAEVLGSTGFTADVHLSPGRLSGGQQRLVALARALAIDPALLILDEPLDGLDASVRAATRRLLRERLGGFAGPRILVTHDPVDAFSLADRVVVLENGTITQTGPLLEVAARPRSAYVAGLLGTNLFPGVGTPAGVKLDAGSLVQVPGEVSGPVFVRIDPRSVALHHRRPEGSPRNVWPGVVDDLDRDRDRVRVRFRPDGSTPGTVLTAEITVGAREAMALSPGTSLWASAKASEVVVYER